MEKSYKHTSIQDIINNLRGLSKGAIYHHFKSKEDILIAVTDRMTAESNKILADIRDRSDLNGMEKLKAIFRESISRPVQNDIFTVAPDFHNSPKLLFSLLHDTIDNAAPNYFLPIIKQGISDGFVKTDYPEQLAELILLAANVWMNPMIFDSFEEKGFQIFSLVIYLSILQYNTNSTTKTRGGTSCPSSASITNMSKFISYSCGFCSTPQLPRRL